MKSVTAAIIVREGRYLLARRSEGQNLAGFWEFPGGKIEANETPKECLIRELREELYPPPSKSPPSRPYPGGTPPTNTLDGTYRILCTWICSN